MIEQKIGQRSTDEAFVKLMTLSGDALLKLLGMESQAATTYRFRATVLKQKRLEPDIEGWSLAADGFPRVVLEFQGYKDAFIRHRLIAKVFTICAQDSYDGPVLAGIIYTDEPYEKAALPLTALERRSGCRFDDCFVEVVLSDFSEEQLKRIDPRLLILAPLTLQSNIDPEALKRKGRDWQKEVNENFPEESRYEALEIMGLFALDRLRTMNVKEIIQMLNLDPTKSGGIMRLYDEGRQEGRQEGGASLFLLQLEEKFNKISDSIRDKVLKADRADLEKWSLRFVRANALNDVFRYDFPLNH